MLNSYILQIGIANPVNRFSQQKTAEQMAAMLALSSKETKKLVRLYKKTEIEYRYSVINDHQIQIPFASTAQRMELYEKFACGLAKQAVYNGINQNDFKKITHLITVSCTGQYAPGWDIELIKELGLSTSIERTAINFMGCYGVFNALKVANYICNSDSDAYVLVISVELCSLHLQPMHTLDNLIANAIFADGAACALIHSQPMGKKSLSIKKFYCDLVADDQQAMAWFVRNNGFDIRLSSYVPKILSDKVYWLTQNLLKHLQMSLEDIDFFAIHPGGKEILNSVEKALFITADKNQEAHLILREYGNMSSATILFVLKTFLERVTDNHHSQNMLAMAFGPGLTVESALLGVHCV